MILQFNFKRICELYSPERWPEVKSKPKRRKLAANESGPTPAQDSAASAKQSLIPIVDREISFTGKYPVDMRLNPDFGVGFLDPQTELREFHSTKEIKLKLHKQQPVLEVYGSSFGDRYNDLLLSLKIVPKYDLGEIASELAVLHTTPKRLKAIGIVLRKSKIKVVFNMSLNTIKVTIDYSISLGCSIESLYQAHNINRLNPLIYSGFQGPSHDNSIPPATSQSFYNAVSAHTATIEPVDFPLAPKGLTAQLMPFQQKTTNWLLNMEGLEWDKTKADFIRQPLVSDKAAIILRDYQQSKDAKTTKVVQECLIKILNRLSFGWEVVTGKNARNKSTSFLYNPYTADLTSLTYACDWLLGAHPNTNTDGRLRYIPAQGLLAEEMGLGKTVEMIGLICANPRPADEIDQETQIQFRTFGDLKTVFQAKTTLIIAPESIIGQWMEEIGHLAPGLRVCLYGGIKTYPKLDNLAPLIAKYLRKFDVVFATYTTISGELDLALFTVNARNTRSSLQRSTSREANADAAEGEDSEHEDFDTHRPVARQPVDMPYEARMPFVTTRQAVFLSKRVRKFLAAQTELETKLQEEVAAEAKASDEYRSFRYNTQSPLIFIQFWRVILDEVQMVSSSYSRAFRIAALIPRFHAWGVSGTPIKRGIDDLRSILQFLGYSPFCGDILRKSWRLLVANQTQFGQLWTSICLRHTKAMVHHQIQLPPQNRILLSIPLSRIEQDYYLQTLNECLSVIGLDNDGHPTDEYWESSPRIMLLMNMWLIRLRQICCSPQIGKLDDIWRSNDEFTSVEGIKTLECLLGEMKAKTFRDVTSFEHDIVNWLLARGEFLEFIYEPSFAQGYLLEGMRLAEQNKSHYTSCQTSLTTVLQLIESSELARSRASRIRESLRIVTHHKRVWTLTLHRFYFLLASCFFQQHDSEFTKKRSQNGLGEYFSKQIVAKFDLAGAKSSTRTVLGTSEFVSAMYGVKASELDENAAFFSDLRNDGGATETLPEKEVRYYALAEGVREELLKIPIANVEAAIKSRLETKGWSDDVWEPPLDDGDRLLPKYANRICRGVLMIKESEPSQAAASPATQLHLVRIEAIFNTLNRQAVLINRWMNDLLRLLSKRMMSHDKTLNGDEYEESLQDQTKISVYLHILEQAITDRGSLINAPSVADLFIQKTNTVYERRSHFRAAEDNQFGALVKILWAEVNLKLKYSLDSVVAELAVELANHSNNCTGPQVPKYLEIINNKCENQKQNCILFRNTLKTHCNAIFNTRIEYFKQLQQISDSVKDPSFGMDREHLKESKVQNHLKEEDKEHARLQNQLDKAVTKFRYLQTLEQSEMGGGSVEDSEDMLCIICRSDITIGTLTHCGHTYCQECLAQWLKKRKTCPMCSAYVTENSVHHFAHYKPDLKATKVHERKHHNDKSGQLSIYQLLPESSIANVQEVKLSASYSSKIDLIVKQALVLIREDPTVKIVVFSQWQDMLYLVGLAFRAAKISYVASHGTIVPGSTAKSRSLRATPDKFDSVERFKDPYQDITCFFLNARAQASGLTLVNATHIFLCEPLVNTSLELQAISRIHRIGQQMPTTVWMFAIENTVEESIVVTSNTKRLQYAEGRQGTSTGANTQPSSIDVRSQEVLSEIDSKALMDSGGGDLVIGKGQGQGELVTDDDLWNAFFGAKSTFKKA